LKAILSIFVIVLFCASPAAQCASSESELFQAFWAAVDQDDERALRKLVDPDHRPRNLSIYLEQYVAFMATVRTRLPDRSAYGYALVEPQQLPEYDPSIPALFKANQLDVYPVAADAFLQLTVKEESGLAELELIPLNQQDGQWWLVFPQESVAWPGLESRFRARQEQRAAGDPGLVPLPVHVELPAYPASMAESATSGCARIGFVIDTDGQPDESHSAQSEPSGLPGRAARDALKKWRFTPPAQLITSELVFVFLAASADAEGVAQLAAGCGGQLENSFVITPTGGADINRSLKPPQQSAPEKRY
jgi:TonB family protein